MRQDGISTGMPDTLHLICERDVGLFSLIQQVIAQIPWALGENRIPIAFFGSRCCYWTPAGYADKDTVWEYYFEPVVPTHPAESIPAVVRAALAERLAQSGLSISTSLIERLNLTLRHALAPLVRKSQCFCKDRTHMRQRVTFFQAFYNFARPHMSFSVAERLTFEQ